MSNRDPSLGVVQVARHLAAELDKRNQEYALGGAIALGYWGSPRGTLDVDLTIFLSPDKPAELMQLLRAIGCEFDAIETTAFLKEHGFCRAKFGGFRVDLFLPTHSFYEAARVRRKRVDLEGQPVMIWDAETLTVFKMMFFRDKDFVDINQMLRNQGVGFDRTWVRERLVEIFGQRDPRLARWEELAASTPDS
jgi:hypothetical protein